MALFAVLTTQAPKGISADEFKRRLPEGFSHHVSLVDKGIVKHSWIRVGESGGLNIYDVSSHEELVSALYDNPLSPHIEFTVFPIVDAGSFDVEAFAESAG
ncbi:hypothetical protein GCM10009836_35340 [Pseudonocardia ailaonensis]|uniref:Muconolactone isomerase domain-containing protein n=1 Tax=Pseudonocardia ailaonensis TaxID=367279 RepID=A0ABN2N535_9PSEU